MICNMQLSSGWLVHVQMRACLRRMQPSKADPQEGPTMEPRGSGSSKTCWADLRGGGGQNVPKTKTSQGWPVGNFSKGLTKRNGTAGGGGTYRGEGGQKLLFLGRDPLLLRSSLAFSGHGLHPHTLLFQMMIAPKCIPDKASHPNFPHQSIEYEEHADQPRHAEKHRKNSKMQPQKKGKCRTWGRSAREKLKKKQNAASKMGKGGFR